MSCLSVVGRPAYFFFPCSGRPHPPSQLPLSPTEPIPANARLAPGGVQPDLRTPTLISWSFRIQQALTANTAITVGYVGSHGYHELIGIDANEPFPAICPAAPCPATYPGTFPAGLAGRPVPAGTYYVPTPAKSNPALANTWAWFSEGDSSYHFAPGRHYLPLQPRPVSAGSLHMVKDD
jgi:hypothetical protein